jgi:hypothetical protein
MSEFLFDVKETLSPRLAWMRKHGVMLHATGYNGTSEEAGDCDGEPEPFCAIVNGGEKFNDFACGQTENEALALLAKNKGWKLWV